MFRLGGSRWLLLPAASALALLIALGGPGGSASAHGGGDSVELDVVGQLDLRPFGSDFFNGMISDVWAHTAPSGKSYAYLGTFDEPLCSLDSTGVYVVDISDPENPQQAGFITSPPNTRANDVKVAHIETRFFDGDILIHSNEFCAGGFLPRFAASGVAFAPGNTGIAIYDVTNPLRPRVLKQNFLNFQVHNTFIYQQGDRAYVLVVDDENLRDFHIVDITNPRAPREVSAQGWIDWFDPATDQLLLGGFPFPFLHDVWATVEGNQVTAYLSYWDAGLVLLDISNPANPVFLGDSDYADPDPITGKPPEGNSHVAVPSPDGNLVLMGDEDFSHSVIEFEITSGGFTGPAAAVEGAFTEPIINEPDGALNGPASFVGRACTISGIPEAPTPPAGQDAIALIERGDCRFDAKISNAAAKSYDGAIVFNSAAGGEGLVLMGGDSDLGLIPAVFVRRSTGFHLLDMESVAPRNPNINTLPPVGTPGQTADATATFDGWGYLRVLDVSDLASITELGQFATLGVTAVPVPFPGDRTIHNIVVDPDGPLAYVSWYAEGMRVVDYSDPTDPCEVAHFIDSNGSNFWGVFQYEHPSAGKLILGSDRDSGLWIFAPPASTDCP